MQGLTLEQFLSFTHATEEDLMEQMKEEAKKRVSYRLMLEAISKKEKIVVSDQEADQEADTMALKYKMKKEDLLKEFGNLEMIKYDLLIRKTIDLLKGE
jgi:trigger factor